MLRDTSTTVERLKRRARMARLVGFAFVYAVAGLAAVIAVVFGVVSPNYRITAELSLDNLETNIWFLIAPAILRIGAVLVAVFLIQILVSFARYYFKLADHLDACSVALELTSDPKEITILVATLSPANLGFGRMPEVIQQKALNAVSDLAKSVRGAPE